MAFDGFDGKVALVTGAAGGVGRAIVENLAGSGAQVAVNDIDAESVVAFVEDLNREGIPALAVPADVARSKQVNEMVGKAIEYFGKIDILVNNAAVFAASIFVADITDEEWDRVFVTNFNSVFYCCRAVIKPMMEQREGVIVNLTSFTGKTGRVVYSKPGEPAKAHYCASKAGIISLTRSLAHELAPHGIRVNGIGAGSISTGPTSPEKDAMLSRIVPLGRTGTAQEIVDAVLFLASPKSSFITGEILNVNGGTLMD